MGADGDDLEELNGLTFDRICMHLRICGQLFLMSKVVVQSIGMSLDGFAAGTDQSLENPLGVRGPELMEWFFPTKTFKEQHGGEGGETGIDDGFAAESMSGKGAWILGRNMFGPVLRALAR